MKKTPSLLLLLAIVIAVAACTSWLVFNSRREAVGSRDAHSWIHSKLGLTPEQEKAIEPIERRYQEKVRALEQQMHLGNQDLARVILEDREDSERVLGRIERIHVSMGELQNITISHVFELRPILTPAQYDKLLQLTANALSDLGPEHVGK